MRTKWGEQLDIDNVLQEYPRPQMVRESYINLNGFWDYSITENDSVPLEYDGKILVPFSPESELSTVNRQLKPSQYLWYHREVRMDNSEISGHVLLHFGAIDQEAWVYVNGFEIVHHIGGYLPFTADITKYISADNDLLIKVKDPSDKGTGARGKQKLKRGEIWYTAQSGIWQTVWMEIVPEHFICDIKLTPNLDKSEINILVIADNDYLCTTCLEGKEFTFKANNEISIHLDNMKIWTPENPYLYDIVINMEQDSIKSYFGMRKFSVGKDKKGNRRFFLNNRPYFHNGILDQGYYCDGLYTAPSDEAMINDIMTAKKLGFNMLRKHVKIEPLRWYYHCDRIGMLVWQDMVNGGGKYNDRTIQMPLITGVNHDDHKYSYFSRTDEQGRIQFMRELEEMICKLYNVVSIAVWVPFNEGWGQFDSVEAVNRIKAIDATRSIDHASGWHDQGIGDIKSYHVYFKRFNYKKDKLARAVALSEFGGYNYMVKDHCFGKSSMGYKNVRTKERFMYAYKKLYKEQIWPAYKKGLAAAVYTQLTDVEDEHNGLMTYDRKILKCDWKKVRVINSNFNKNLNP